MIREISHSDFYLLLLGTYWTVGLTLMSLFLGSVLGLALALFQVFGGAISKLVARVYIETLQATPVLLLLFLASYNLSYLGLKLPALASVTLALSLYCAAFLADIWRGSIQAVDTTQWQASESLAMTRYQQCRYVIFPQALRTALAPTVGFIAQLVKNTSIASIVGFMELTRTGQLVNNETFQPFIVFAIVAAIYFVICFPLSTYSQHLERKLYAHR